MLSCIDVGYSKHTKSLFSHISFTALPGAIVKIVGSNGVGKTTFLRILAGIMNPKNGYILHTQGNYINYIGHYLGIRDDFAVLEQLIFWSEINGTKILIPSALKYCNLEELVDTSCYKLSAGQRQKLAIAKLLVSGANIWILDEIDSSLDENNSILLKNLLSMRANNGGIIIFTSHRDFLPFSFKIEISNA